MANDTPPDPGAQFRELVTTWERAFDKIANEVMGTDAYTAWMNQLQQGQMAAQKAFAEFASRQMSQMNMPTREDVIRLAEAVRKMDQRLERIEERLAAGSAAAPEAKPGKQKKPARTRKPPSKKKGAKNA